MQGCCYPNPSMASRRCKSSDGNVIWSPTFYYFCSTASKQHPLSVEMYREGCSVRRLLGGIADEGSFGWKSESLTVAHQSIIMVVHERPPIFLWIRYGSAGKIFFQSAVMNWRNSNDVVVQWKAILQSMAVDDVQKMVVLQTQNNPSLTTQIFLLSSSHYPFFLSKMPKGPFKSDFFSSFLLPNLQPSKPLRFSLIQALGRAQSVSKLASPLTPLVILHAS